MVPGATVLALLCLALLPACLTHGERLASPQAVRFAGDVARHLLRWEPGHGCPSTARYDVEYKVYGSSIPWTAVPECRNTSERSCDLTGYTLDPERRYYARVRAVSGHRTSPWKRSSAFSPQEAGPCLVGHSLSVLGNSIQVRLQPLRRSGNISAELGDFMEKMTRYHVHVRRTLDNRTLTVVKNSTEFSIGELLWLTEYCLSVEPSMANRPVPSTRTGEQCVTTGHRDMSAELLPVIFSCSGIILLLLGLLGALLAHTYLKKPGRTPSVLKSFMKQSSLWVEHEPAPSGSLEADPVQQLVLCQKEPWLASSPESSPSTAQPCPEQGWKLPAWPKDQLCLLGPPASRDSSGTSTDSGICLHVPSSSSLLSCSVGPEPQGYRQQLPTAEDSGVGLGSPCPAPGCSSGSGNAGLGEPGVQEDVQFRGYLQQCKGTVEPEQSLGRAEPLSGCAGPEQSLGRAEPLSGCAGPEQSLGRAEPLSGCAGPEQGPGSADTVLDTEGCQLAASKGYLKQSAPQHPLSQDLAPWGAPAWDFSSQLGPQASTLLSWAAPGAPLPSKAGPDVKTPFDLNIFSSAAFLGTLPLVSGLSSSWVTPPLGPPSLCLDPTTSS